MENIRQHVRLLLGGEFLKGEEEFLRFLAQQLENNISVVDMMILCEAWAHQHKMNNLCNAAELLKSDETVGVFLRKLKEIVTSKDYNWRGVTAKAQSFISEIVKEMENETVTK